MTDEAKKIINWAASQDNGHGAHISALIDATKSNAITDNVKVKLLEKLAEWSNERDVRLSNCLTKM